MKFCALVLCVGVVAADSAAVLEFEDTVGTCKIQKDDGTLNLDCDTVIDNKLKVGNSISNLWSADLPVGVDMIRTTPDGRCCGGSAPYSSDSGDYASGPCFDVSGCGYATGKLHMKTNMLCANPANAMYHLEFRGHLFRAKKAFFCEAVGYLAAAGLTHTNAACHHAPSDIYHDMGISTYCTTDGYLAFALTDPGHTTDGNLWHASDIVVNYVGGSGNYVARGSLLEITESAISPLDEEFCGGAYCDYVEVDQNLIGHWTYDDSTCNDKGGAQTTANLATPAFSDAVNGKSLRVTGGNGCTVNSLSNHVWGRKFSSCTWFNRDSNNGNYMGIVSTGYHKEGAWEFRLGREGGGTQGGGGIMDALAWHWFLPENTFPVGQWNHVCMTYDADAGADAGIFYVNGVETGTRGTSFGDMKTTSQAVHIGSGTGREGFVGQIDDTRIYSVAIGPDIVQAIYDLEKA